MVSGVGNHDSSSSYTDLSIHEAAMFSIVFENQPESCSAELAFSLEKNNLEAVLIRKYGQE